MQTPTENDAAVSGQESEANILPKRSASNFIIFMNKISDVYSNTPEIGALKALGITVPPPLLGRADEVIE